MPQTIFFNPMRYITVETLLGCIERGEASSLQLGLASLKQTNPNALNEIPFIAIAVKKLLEYGEAGPFYGFCLRELPPSMTILNHLIAPAQALNPNKKNAQGETPLQILLSSQKMWHESYFEQPTLINKHNYYIDSIQKIINHPEFLPNIITAQGQTYLTQLATLGMNIPNLDDCARNEIIRIAVQLLHKGADPDLKDASIAAPTFHEILSASQAGKKLLEDISFKFIQETLPATPAYS